MKLRYRHKDNPEYIQNIPRAFIVENESGEYQGCIFISKKGHLLWHGKLQGLVCLGSRSYDNAILEANERHLK